MKTELEKCMVGEIYNCHDEIFLEYKKTARALLPKYNGLPYDHKSEKREVLEGLFGSIGNNVSVGSPFICDYGCNIYLGNNVSVNPTYIFKNISSLKIFLESKLS